MELLKFFLVCVFIVICKYRRDILMFVLFIKVVERFVFSIGGCYGEGLWGPLFLHYVYYEVFCCFSGELKNLLCVYIEILIRFWNFSCIINNKSEFRFWVLFFFG